MLSRIHAQTNRDSWAKKFERTVERDRKAAEQLDRLGWRFMVIWECELRNPDLLCNRIRIEEKPEVKKAGGVFYTPVYIVARA